jgi:hypothetical protein
MLVLLLALSVAGTAQQADTQAAPQTGSPQIESAQAGAAEIGPESPKWAKLSIEDKLRYDARHLLEVDNLIFAGIGAGIDQARERPEEWGEGWSSFAQRYGSHVGQYLVQRSIMFPVQAIDGEDPRYFRSKRTSLRGRVGDALLQTVWRHDDSGGMMPAYSEFFGDYGAAAVSRAWWPQRFHNGKAIFVAGTNTMLVDAGINVLREFAPDIKRWLHLGH